MLPLPAASGLLLPAKAQLTAAALPKYRELLRKTRSNNGGLEESSSLFQQAKERVLLRLRERRRTARVDPRRAFSRLQDRLAAARLSLRDLKNEQKERLRQYYATAVAGGSSRAEAAATVQAAGEQQQQVAAARAAAGVLDARAAQAALGTDGPLRHLVLAGVGGACKLFLAAGTRTSIQGSEHMEAALARAPGQGLITVSNHVGSIDDPLITTSIVPASKLLEPQAVRWTMCATDRCFKSKALVPFFRAAKVLPVERGAGLSQFGMQLAQSRLVAGEWVHIFPEGTRSRDGRMLPVRKGVGWLVASAAAAGTQPPLVLPFVHSGMETIMPKGTSLPKLGQELRVLVGEPVAVDDLLAEAAQQGWTQDALQVAITDRVGQALYQLKAELDDLPLEAVAPQPRAAAISFSEDTLLPMIEDEMDSMAHRWQDKWQRLSLPSLTQRMRQAVAARRAALAANLSGSLFAGSESSGGGGSAEGSVTFQDIAAATEESSGIISSWEHAEAAPMPWAVSQAAAAEEAGWAQEAWEAPAGASSASEPGPSLPALLVRQKLRLLRGSMLQSAAATLRSAGSTDLAASTAAVATPASGGSSTSGTSSSNYSGLEVDAHSFVAASPLDLAATAAAMGPGCGSSSSGTLQLLVQTAADYSRARVVHMKELLTSTQPTAPHDPASMAHMAPVAS